MAQNMVLYMASIPPYWCPLARQERLYPVSTGYRRSFPVARAGLYRIADAHPAALQDPGRDAAMAAHRVVAARPAVFLHARRKKKGTFWFFSINQNVPFSLSFSSKNQNVPIASPLLPSLMLRTAF